MNKLKIKTQDEQMVNLWVDRCIGIWIERQIDRNGRQIRQNDRSIDRNANDLGWLKLESKEKE